MIFDCQRHPAIRPFDYFLNRLPTSSGHPIISSIDCQRRPAIRLFPQSIAQRHPTIRLFPQSIGIDCPRRPAIRLFPQSITQGLHPGLGCVASSTLERMNFIPPRCIFQQPLFSSSSNPHTILWISNNLHVDDNISS